MRVPASNAFTASNAIRRVLCLGAIATATAGAAIYLAAVELRLRLRYGFRREPTLSDLVDRAVQQERSRTHTDRRTEGDHHR